MILFDFLSIFVKGQVEILFWRAKFKSHLCLTLCLREKTISLCKESGQMKKLQVILICGISPIHIAPLSINN